MSSQEKSRRKRRRIRSSSSVSDVESGVNTGNAASGMYNLLFPLAYIFTLIYIFTIPFENTFYIEDVGSISRAAGFPMLVLWILLLLLKQSVRSFVPFYIFSALFVVWGALSLFWSRHPDVTQILIFSYAQLFLASYFIWLTLKDQGRCVTAMQVYLAGGCVAVGFVFWNYFTNNLAELGDRAGIEGIDLNELAMSISLALPIAWYLATRPMVGFNKFLVSVVSYVFVPCGMLAIIMTGSRGGFASTVPTALYILMSFFYIGKGAKLLGVLVVVVAVMAVLQYLPEVQFARIATFSEELETGDISSRGELWRIAIELWLESPMNSILGIGVGSYGAEVGIVAHSTYLSILAEAGVLGFIIFLFILLSLFFAATRSQRDARYLSLALLTIWGVGAASLTWEYSKTTWFVWSFIVCIAYAYRGLPSTKPVKRRRRRSRQSATATD